jgi:hypothetical protein
VQMWHRHCVYVLAGRQVEVQEARSSLIAGVS